MYSAQGSTETQTTSCKFDLLNCLSLCKREKERKQNFRPAAFWSTYGGYRYSVKRTISYQLWSYTDSQINRQLICAVLMLTCVFILCSRKLNVINCTKSQSSKTLNNWLFIEVSPVIIFRPRCYGKSCICQYFMHDVCPYHWNKILKKSKYEINVLPGYCNL